MNKITILGVEIDRINMEEALNLVEDWVNQPKKQGHFIVTPNIEFIMASQSDNKFKEVINKADLKIPDSARLGAVELVLKNKNIFYKIFTIPFVLFPKLLGTKDNFPVVTGTDLMAELIKLGDKKAFTVGFLGGKNGVAEKLGERLKKDHPNLKIVLAEDGPVVDNNGEVVSHPSGSESSSTPTTVYNLPSTDILFVAFGQVKQEKWIASNLEKLPVKVAIGVGGAFDYLSGNIPRAPKFMRGLGFEWFYRLIVQPWRIKRQLVLGKFLIKLVLS